MTLYILSPRLCFAGDRARVLSDNFNLQQMYNILMHDLSILYP